MKIRPDNQKFTEMYRRFLHRVAGGVVLLLKTSGRKSGREHTVGLQYELINDRYYVGAADGSRADWLKNIQANPEVRVQAGNSRFRAKAMVVSDQGETARFLAYRLKKRPLLFRMVLSTAGFKGKLDQAALEKYAQTILMVIFTPFQDAHSPALADNLDFSL
jgi:deazaflavin-dependent oxidoreductase (nitroreductase family)